MNDELIFPEEYDNTNYFKIKYFDGTSGKLIGYEIYELNKGQFSEVGK